MIKEKNVALVLEGGGVKCAYQVGAMMALKENGYNFKAISGASFGALNGALYIEGGIERLFYYYNNFQTIDLFKEQKISDFVNNYNGDKNSFTSAYIRFMEENASSFFNDRNMISDHYHNYVASLVDEEKIRNSDIDYMFSVLEVTNNPLTIPMILGAYFSRNLAPLKMLENNGSITTHIYNKNDIKKGLLPLFVAGSANYPFFNPLQIEDKYYLDGGITNNAPYEALIDKGYKDIIIIRTKNDDLQGKIPQNDNIFVITPSENLGSSIQFTHDNIMEFIKLGYSDTIKLIKE